MNSFGRIFRASIFGESHGEAVGIVIDGCPAGLSISERDFKTDLSRRRPGARGTTPRKEKDAPQLVTGIFKGKTTGAPITILFKNRNVDSKNYNFIKSSPRPGHADFVALKKYGGYSDYRGGGHFSGRLTLPIVAAGVVAKKIISPIKIEAKLTSAGNSTNIKQAVNEALREEDSIGGIIECWAENMPVGLGEPFFDSAEALISHAIFSIPAVKGVEFGAGFDAARMRGSEHNDPIVNSKGKTETNFAGGINGGITNGNDLGFRVAIKPPSSIGKTQRTYNFKKEKMGNITVKGRHDACIALRAPVIVEAMTAIVLADLSLIEQTIPRRVR